MTPIWQCLCWKVGLTNARAICKKRETAQALAFGISGISIVLGAKQAVGQLNPDTAPDRNLGTTVRELNSQTDLIEGGTRPQKGTQNGPNLFHSFSEFNVLQGRAVYFQNPTGVENILSRVTGNSASNISGTLGVFGKANLFLINPNGMIFGANATLDVEGSFVATTANAILLGDTGRFSASEPASSNLLTIQPSALFFNQLPTQAIVNRSKAFGFSQNTGQLTQGLHVPDGQSLLFVGGEVRLEGGILQAPGGRVELGGIAGSGNVALNFNGNTPSLDFPTNVARADVSITNAAGINVVNGGSGSIAINARNIDVLDSSYLSAGRILSDTNTNNSQPGDITLNATEAINIFNGSSVLNVILGSGT